MYATLFAIEFTVYNCVSLQLFLEPTTARRGVWSIENYNYFETNEKKAQTSFHSLTTLFETEAPNLLAELQFFLK